VLRRLFVFVLAACALPAPAQTFDFTGRSSSTACISIADTSYRIAAPGERADYTVRLDPAAAANIRVAFSASIDTADLVLIGNDAASRCQDGAIARTVRIDPVAQAPDLTVGFVAEATPADYRIYLRGTAVAPEIAAALFAMAQMSARRAAGRIETSALTVPKP
jgi:hypothetical protein